MADDEVSNNGEKEIQIEQSILTDEEVDKMKVSQLKTELRRRQLKTTGLKKGLVARLKAALIIERDRDDSEDDEEVEDEDDNENEDDQENEDNEDDEDETVPASRAPASGTRRRRREPVPQPQLTFRDVEESLEKFSGDDYINVNQWIQDFEETADLCAWSDVQKVTYAKRLLKGSAKLFVNHEKCAKNWEKLKKALKGEFDEVVDSYHIHQELSQRKKRTDETHQQYVYRMLEIASQAMVDTQSVIQYIIQGIPDEAANKTLLYGAKNIRQLKEKLTQYEALKRDMKSRSKAPDKKDDGGRRHNARDVGKRYTEGSSAVKVKRCYNCGEKDHLSAECPTKEKGVKCFKCNGFGHVAAKCAGKNKEAFVVSRLNKQKYVKEVVVEDRKFVALVDTGSDLTFMRSDEYEKIGSPVLGKRKLKFEGLGSTGNVTLGEFTKSMNVDGDEFLVTFHVVPTEILKHGLLLGTDFLDKVELRVRQGIVSFLKLDDAKSESYPEIFAINTISEANEIELSYINDKCYRDEVKKMITDYKPEKTRDVGIKTKIILSSEVPVGSRPRRLSAEEKQEVDELTSVWLDEGDDNNIKELIEQEWTTIFEEDRDELRVEAKNTIAKIQDSNKRGYDKKRKMPNRYSEGEWVAIKRTQLGRPMTATKKRYQHVLVVVDAFTKFVWLYPTKSTDAAEVIDRLTKQSFVFGNPRRIVSDRGTAFTSQAFKDYCKTEKIEHTMIVTGVPRGNGQVERVNRTLLPLLAKLTSPIPENWYKYIEAAQRYLNATLNRGTAIFEEDRDELRAEAKNTIAKIQDSNKRGYDKKRKMPNRYSEGEWVAIKRTQLGSGSKLKAKYLGPYKISRAAGDETEFDKADETEYI
ncbi:uncharacterized protein LOC112905971 [Agrilus planipennis]|uniref:Uncharacterized protein LOC112905971 n=1 Tax=Agrilus planipennis TaxID=224129 RepID=A0A7F5RGX1_AGRPL|nr:uncharacterized protein LOC112905971 [Agrilus planipennis]